MSGKSTKTISSPEPYAGWLETLKAIQGGRPGYKDQTEDSLRVLVEIARTYRPDRVFEIGTSYGASTRAWAHAGVSQITCIDLTFNPLRLSLGRLPIEGAALTLLERSIGEVRLGELAAACQRPLIFFDCHGADNMRYVLNQLSGLSHFAFVVDDMWYSPAPLDEWEAQVFCKNVVEAEIDVSLPKSLWPQSFANYWAGGAFYSFDEVVPLLAYANARHLTLQSSSKEAWWIQEAA